MVGHHQCEAGLPTEAIGDGSRSDRRPAAAHEGIL